jgi:hypothetical protein
MALHRTSLPPSGLLGKSAPFVYILLLTLFC